MSDPAPLAGLPEAEAAARTLTGRGFVQLARTWPDPAAAWRYAREVFRSGIPLGAVQQSITLGPGEVLMMDNLRTAHGRSGQRNPQELHQLFVGYPALNQAQQRVLLDYALAAF
jgi:hypothetical protein